MEMILRSFMLSREDECRGIALKLLSAAEGNRRFIVDGMTKPEVVSASELEFGESGLKSFMTSVRLLSMLGMHPIFIEYSLIRVTSGEKKIRKSFSIRG